MPKDQYVDYAPRTAQRWDTERFVSERDRAHGQEVTRIEDRNVRMSGALRPPRRRDHSADSDDISDRRGPRGGYEEDYIREREVYRDDPRDLPVRSRTTVEREAERQYYRSPSPPRMKRPGRPSMLRRQSSLDTFDRKPTIPRYVEREEYGPPALRPEREYDDDRVYTGRVRVREIVRSRRRSLSSSSRSDSSEASSVRTSKSMLPRKGKTRMPAKLVSKRAIIELGYPFEEEGTTIIIQKALGRHHIDEVLLLSEKYRSETKIIEEKHTERVYSPPYSPPLHAHQIVHAPTPPPAPAAPTFSSHGPEIIQVDPPRTHLHSTDLVKTTRGAIYEERFHSPHYHYRSRSMGPTPRHEYIEPSLALAPIPAFPHRHYHDHHHHDGRIIRVERIEDAEYSRAPDGELVLYDRDREFLEPVAAVRRDRKGRMSMVVSKRYR